MTPQPPQPANTQAAITQSFRAYARALRKATRVMQAYAVALDDARWKQWHSYWRQYAPPAAVDDADAGTGKATP